MAQRFGSFTTGHAVTAAELNSGMGSGVYTSGTRPTGTDVYEGLRIWETDTNRIVAYDGTNWVIMAEPVQTATLTVTQSGSVTVTNSTASYHRSDGWLTLTANLAVTGSGTGSNPILIAGLPVAMATLTPSTVIGSGAVYDVSATTMYPGVACWNSTTTIALFGRATNGAYLGQGDMTAALAAGDLITLWVHYRMTNRYT